MIYVFLAATTLLTGFSLVAWQQGNYGRALLLLMAAAFALRLLMAGLDPFLHDWDERYHAIVARNLMSEPFRPRLHPAPLLPYDYKAWCCNYIWLHKQPLFMWQMALSMKLFGVSAFTLRLPSVLLSTLLLYPVYRLGALLFNRDSGYLAAFLVMFAFYQLEQVSGLIGMDHNDVAFMCYVTASVWAYAEYRASEQPWRWAVAVGVLAGAAVLCKWLVGLVVFAVWGLSLLLDPARRRKMSEYGRLIAAGTVAALVFLPWQLYTAWRFPSESSYERIYNARHFSEVLENQANPWYYHFKLMPIHYGLVALLIGLGIGLALRLHRDRPWGPTLAVVGIIYLFFTLAATRMYSYVYVVSPLLLVFGGLALAHGQHWLAARVRHPAPWLMVGALAVVLISARPWGIVTAHFLEGSYGLHQVPLNREVRTANAMLYQQLAQDVPADYTIFNAPSGSEVEVMFYSGRNAYSWLPPEADMRRLSAAGTRFAFFPSFGNQGLPTFAPSLPGSIMIWGLPR